MMDYKADKLNLELYDSSLLIMFKEEGNNK